MIVITVLAIVVTVAKIKLAEIVIVSIMVFILDVCSFDYAHTWSKLGISIC